MRMKQATRRHVGVEQVARDIANSAVEDVLGRRPARHRKQEVEL